MQRIGTYVTNPYGDRITNRNTHTDPYMLNPGFVPSIRPIYATANYARLARGPLNWGMSYLVLKEDTRRRATYICQDSFNALLKKAGKKAKQGGYLDKTWRENPDLASQYVATGANLYRLLAYMPENMFRSLIDVALGRVKESSSPEEFAASYGLDEYDYIEVHYHGVLNIHRDLRHIAVSMTEAIKDNHAWQVYRRYFYSRRTPVLYVE